MATTPDTRAITLVDIPLLRRLSGCGMVLDSEFGLTRDARGAHSAHLSRILFTRGVYTLVARSDSQRVVGQFRYRPDDFNAHITYIAPALPDDEEEAEDTVWLHILDAMAREAGKHGAHNLVAEVETSSRLFETLRLARFATYLRQTILRHEPITLEGEPPVKLTEETGGDQVGIMSLICSTIPTMVQPVATPNSDMHGLVYRPGETVDAYVAISEGEHGIYLIPYIHPDAYDSAAAILEAAVAQTQRADKVPIYVSVRSYQNWLEPILQELRFERWIEQAVMVKHIAAGIRHPGFSPIRVSAKQLKTVRKVAPHNWSVTRHYEEDVT